MPSCAHTNAVNALISSYETADELIAAVGDDDLERPVPSCPEWDVRALLNHFVNALAFFPTTLAGGEPYMGEDAIGDDPLGAFRNAVITNLAAWRDGDNSERDAGMLPGMKLVDLNLIDAVAHSWDLAKALGTDVTFDDEVVALVYDRWKDAPLDKSREFGAFGPPVEVPADAPVFDRLLGLVGRDPYA